MLFDILSLAIPLTFPRFLHPMRCLYRSMCNAAQNDQEQCCCKKSTSPSPIFNHSGVTPAAHYLKRKLTQGSDIHLQKNPWNPADGRPKHIGAKRNSRYAIKIIQQARGEKRMQLTQKNYLPALALQERFQGEQCWVLRKPAPKPLHGHPAAQSK